MPFLDAEYHRRNPIPGGVQGRIKAQLKMPPRCGNTMGATDTTVQELIGMSEPIASRTPGRQTPENHGGWDSWTKRFHAGYQVLPNGCWEWQRSRNSRGYGVIYFDKKLRLAHRAAFLIEHGRWPIEGLVVDHVCNNKACVNPAHLREVENWQNLRRAYPCDDPDVMRRRELNRRAQAKRRNYTSPNYTSGSDKGGGCNHLV